MKKILAFSMTVLIVLQIVLSFSSCSSKDRDVPEDMQLVRGSDELGYYFYAPKEWRVSNQGKYSVAYASSVDNSSITFVEAEKPTTTLNDYFNSEKEKFPFPIKVSVNGEITSFGNVDNAYKYVYSYDYKNFSHTCMQIFILRDNKFYIFTFTSYNTEKQKDLTYYQFYLEKVQKVIENFKFVDATGEEINKEDVNYGVDEDGYILISDKVLSGFNLYVPDSYKTDFSSGIVSATRDDGSNINVSKATYTGVTLKDYWKLRKENLENIIDKVKDENGETVSSLKEIKIDEKIELKNTKWAFSYEYSYTMNKKDYHIYQVFIVSGKDGFVFTYTAEEKNYSKHIDEAKKILSKVEF